ncbi:cytochrome P450 2U1-like isoform X1 [Styela clava]
MIAIFSIILICLLSLIYLRKHKKKNLPPGPTGLPIIGYMPFLNKNPALTYTELAKDYGHVFSVQIGTEYCVVLNSRDAIHEALIKNGRLTANRPRIKLLEEINYGLSITFNGGPVWKRQRMFALKTIKGFSKQMIEDKILEEISYLCEDLSKTGDEEIDCQNLLANMTANVMINIFMGFRFPHNEKELGRITSVVTIFSDVGILFLAPFLRHFSIFKKAYSSMLSGFFFLQGKIKSIIEKRQNSSDKKEEYSDFLNKYLDEMNNGQDESFTMRQLIIIIQDILGAGTDTASTSILWCLFALAVFPECQDKISEELNNAIGQDSKVTMEHEEKLPYTRAFIQEVWRHRTPAPLAVSHETTEDMIVQGYNIPAKTTIVPNLWAVHRNPKVFKNPDEFFPERFIDEDEKFIPTDHVMPFCIGSRHCIGEQIARMHVFLVFANIVRQFKIRKPRNKPLPSFNKGVFAVSYSPHEFNIEFHEK